MKCFYLVLIFLLIIIYKSFAQLGCTDVQALNFNINASQNDGSCIYANTTVTPTHVTWLDASLFEISGNSFVQNNFCTINDGANAKLIYYVDTTNGALLDTLALNGANNIDWEDITTSANHFYIGDFGNNIGTRQDLKIYKINQQAIINKDTSSFVQTINFSYNNQSSFAPDYHTNFDCEAFLAYEDSVYLFTKNWGNHKTYCYVLANDTGTQVATLIDSFYINGLITAAAIQNNRIALLGYDTNGISFCWLMWNYNNRNFFSGNKRRLDFGFSGGQVEGICFVDSNHIIFSNEKYSIFNQRLASINIAPYFYNSTSIEEDYKNQVVTIYLIKNDIYIEACKTIKSISIIDLNGRQHFHNSIHKKSCILNLALTPSIYFVEIVLDDNTKVIKEFIMPTQ